MTAGRNWFLKSWKESARMTMVKHQAEFRYQIEELHRLYLKQMELMDEYKATLIRRSNDDQLLKYTRVKKTKFDTDELKVHVKRDTNSPVTPQTMETVGGKQEADCARSAAETLVLMSSSMLWFAKIATSLKYDDDLVFVPKRARGARKPRVADLACRQQNTQHMKLPSQHAKCPIKRTRNVDLKACIGSWGKIKNGRRSKRVGDKNPMSTFQRGALLCRWR